MTTSSSPVPARTDLGRPAAEGGGPTGDRPAVATARRSVRRGGGALTAGALVWVAGEVLYTFGGAARWSTVWDVTSLAFLAGVFVLVAMFRATRATGDGRVARGVLRAEQGLLLVAGLATSARLVVPAIADSVAYLVVDTAWPLSMLGALGIGIRVAIAGVWTGAARLWVLLATSWLPVVLGLSAFLGGDTTGAAVVSMTHLLVGYAALGVLLILRPELTGAR